MRILPIANNQVPNQKQNMNFGSMKVLIEHIPNFQKICPEAHSLSDLIRSRVFDYDTGIIEEVAKKMTGVPQNASKGILPTHDIFLDENEYQLFEDVAAKVSTEMQKERDSMKRATFRERWDLGTTGAIARIKNVISAFVKSADPVTPEQIQAFLPQVRATQAAFIKKCSGK